MLLRLNRFDEARAINQEVLAKHLDVMTFHRGLYILAFLEHFLHGLERRQPRHPHPKGGQGRVREVAVNCSQNRRKNLVSARLVVPAQTVDATLLYLQHVTITTMPEDYESRLTEMFPGRFKKLKILAPDPYDLVLSKLERNSPKDQGDVQYLARTVPLNAGLLHERYERELRPNLTARQSWHDGTLKMWLGAYFPRTDFEDSK